MNGLWLSIHYGNVISPTDFHSIIFQRGGWLKTTNQENGVNILLTIDGPVVQKRIINHDPDEQWEHFKYKLSPPSCVCCFSFTPWSIDTWLVVWNIWIIFPFSWECHHPNLYTNIFQRGRYTTNQISIDISTIDCGIPVVSPPTSGGPSFSSLVKLLVPTKKGDALHTEWTLLY